MQQTYYTQWLVPRPSLLPTILPLLSINVTLEQDPPLQNEKRTV